VIAIYYIGDQVRSKPYRYDPGEHGQRNNAHLVELVGALAPLQFIGTPETQLSDPDGYPLPTKAYEFALDKDEHDITFLTLGPHTRSLIYDPMVRFHLLFLYLRNGFKEMIGQGFTEDEPKIKTDFLASQFYRSLSEQFMEGYRHWLTEMYDNSRSVQLFKLGEWDMNQAISRVATRKGFLGHKNVDVNVFKAEMNRLSRDANSYSTRSVAYKLLDLFYRAAGKVIEERYASIN